MYNMNNFFLSTCDDACLEVVVFEFESRATHFGSLRAIHNFNTSWNAKVMSLTLNEVI